MSRKLVEPQVKVCWRFNSADLAWLRAQVGEGQVNALVRDLVAAYCDAERQRTIAAAG